MIIVVSDPEEIIELLNKYGWSKSENLYYKDHGDYVWLAEIVGETVRFGCSADDVETLKSCIKALEKWLDETHIISSIKLELTFS
ncbi:hypothetical protein [Pyrobaculum aerophilum]|uniref:Uncharacterized protein n=1 Tax=Pyrobaculum aerophilum (strain ATCC 51768 / DSM 7523 / JCM 9630 / CIP 104966 / NBRC 100827 / IM2) TaxID=178306 RepID=Q8ZUW5_PYRAE|nr:hypothetical protein [Pyrobaculum aerophilum]AAL64291.1 hypothetical protein PAE2574 [Pyrobaculum aerophilum str. IM2]MCX8137834.1 hypothetical protein [Pyrobaculum aerophilum]